MAYCRYSERNLTQYSGISAPNFKSFFGDVFSQDKASKPPLYMHTARRKKRSFTGNPARTSAHFSVMFFSQDKENERRRTSVLQAKFDAVLRKNSPKPQLIFRRCFFRKTRKMSADVQAYFKRNLTPYCGKTARNLSSFFGDVFSQDKASKPPLYMHTARRKKRSFTGNPARTSAHFSVMFFRKTRKISDGVLSVLRAKFDTVLRKNSPKNQISIMSASFFFAISSISLTYLSVIF